MVDREKVIKGLQCCKSPNDHEHCPYNTGVHYNVCTYRLLSDALELLKEQEPIQLEYGEQYEEYWYVESICPKCKTRWISQGVDHFCPYCGQAVIE